MLFLYQRIKIFSKNTFYYAQLRNTNFSFRVKYFNRFVIKFLSLNLRSIKMRSVALRTAIDAIKQFQPSLFLSANLRRFSNNN